MRPETPAHLWDAVEAAKRLRVLTTGVTRAEYLADWIRQAAAERQVEIIGEALNRVRRVDPVTAARVPQLHAIIATRNVITHQYDDVDHVRVWAMLKSDVPALIPELDALLAEYGPPSA